MRRHLIPTLLIPTLLAAACGSADRANEHLVDRVAQSAGNTAPVPAEPTERYAVDAGDETATSTAPADASAPPTLPAGGDTAGATPAPGARDVVPQMIIRTGTASVRVDKLEPAMARVEQLARSVGGYVANTSMQTGSESVRRASMELKIPAARWGEALNGLKPIGKLESQATNTEDVGEEYVDVTARMTNARRLESRLLELLGTRTGKLDDVLAVERELARVREEIERAEGRLRYLRTRAAVSTLTVELHEPLPVLAPGRSPILDAFRDAWRNFVGFTAGFIASLGWLIPLLLVLAALLWALRRVFGRPGWPRFRGPKRTPPPPI